MALDKHENESQSALSENKQTNKKLLDAAGKVQNPSETCWLALEKCVIALNNILPSLIIGLEWESEERGDILSGGMYLQLIKYDFMATLELMCEVLSTVNHLSLQFQEEHVDFNSLTSFVDATIRAINEKKNAYLCMFQYVKIY